MLSHLQNRGGFAIEPTFENSFSKGLRDGIPIALGYISVSFTFGMMAVSGGLSVGAALIISLTNVTSAGQFAGLSLIFAGAPFLEMAMTQLVINLRYALMSLSLSQKLNSSVTVLDRMLIAFCNTDEIFAVASGNSRECGKRYMYGLISTPYIGWALGTLLGAAAGNILPESVRAALGIAIYGMFIAIIVPAAKNFRPVLNVTLVAVTLSCLFHWLPGLNKTSSGFAIIICAVVAAGMGALLFPLRDNDGGEPDGC